MSLTMKQKQNHGYGEHTGDCQEGGSWERAGVGDWGQQIQDLHVE